MKSKFILSLLLTLLVNICFTKEVQAQNGDDLPLTEEYNCESMVNVLNHVFKESNSNIVLSYPVVGDNNSEYVTISSGKVPVHFRANQQGIYSIAIIHDKRNQQQVQESAIITIAIYYLLGLNENEINKLADQYEKLDDKHFSSTVFCKKANRRFTVGISNEGNQSYTIILAD